MYDLANFTINDMMKCSTELRNFGQNAKNLEEAANQIVRYLFENLTNQKSGKNGCALVRLYKTHPYSELPSDLQAFAQKVLKGTQAKPGLKCLTLMATAGIRPEWNSRKNSNGHKAVPLSSPQFVEQAPMISRLIKQFGLDVPAVLSPDPRLIMDMAKKEYNVFHVAQAKGSPFIPAQNEFVIPYRIESVLGFGGMFPTGDMVAMIMFSQVSISAEVASRFKPMGPGITGIMLPFVQGRKIFSA